MSRINRSIAKPLIVSGPNAGESIREVDKFTPDSSHIQGYIQAEDKIQYVCDLVGVDRSDYTNWRNTNLRDHLMELESWLWIKSKEDKWVYQTWS